VARLTARLRCGLTRLAWAAGLLGAVFWAAHSISLERLGGPWVLVAIVVAGIWVVDGFRNGPPVRPPASVLRTRRLVLRRALPDDLGRFHEMLSDPEAMHHWDSLPHASLEQSREWFQRMLAPASPELFDDFVIVRRGRVIGMMGSLNLPWVSFLLDRDEWRKGYASEALAAFVRYMFGRGMPYLRAATDTHNAAARALLAKAGFHECGESREIWRVRGEPAVAVHYRLNRYGSEPDLEEERQTIEVMEAAVIAHRLKLKCGGQAVEQGDDADADQQAEQQEG
jgi:RimJ/RimL family protein N-acetyltransferase